jgi:hypothetical protein
MTAQELAEEGDDDPPPWMHSESWAVLCDGSKPSGPGGCGASGGFSPTADGAVRNWNARAVLAAQPLHEQLREMGEAHAAQPAPVPVPLTGYVYLVQYGTQCLEAFADLSAAVAYAYNIGSHAYVACVAVRTPEYATHVFGIAASLEKP